MPGGNRMNRSLIMLVLFTSLFTGLAACVPPSNPLNGLDQLWDVLHPSAQPDEEAGKTQNRASDDLLEGTEDDRAKDSFAKEDDLQKNAAQAGDKNEVREPSTGKGSQKKQDEAGRIIVDDPLSYMVLVDHRHALPEGFEPPDLVEADIPFDKPSGDERRLLREQAARAIEALFQAAQDDGVELIGISGYRSYDLQASIFAYQVQKKGEKEAARVSARPGTSEHQTGLAIDVADKSGKCLLEPCFGEMPAGQWLKAHAHTYGFIIRYPEDGEALTGYMYEPWHLRYVGKEVATTIYERGDTLETYLKDNRRELIDRQGDAQSRQNP